MIKSVESGVSQTQTAKIYKIGLNTVNRWWHRYTKEGLFTAKARGGSRGKVNAQELRLYVEQNSDKTLIEIGKVFKVAHQGVGLKCARPSWRWKPEGRRGHPQKPKISSSLKCTSQYLI